ncbi:MAG: BON domain-containing protein [Nitrospinota bacterium]|nr:MAG: BON domain-containing protein [Nitrospinota bacterium]
MRRRAWIRYCLGMLLFWGAGCASTPTQKSTGEIIDDAVITTKVKVLLIEDKVVKARSIDVDTRKGIVSLNGAVETQAEKERAEAIARSVKGVKGVENHLKVVGK